MTDDADVAVVGVGMHPWGKWGRPFVDYGITAAYAALDDAGIAWSDIEYIAGGETVRNGYSGFVAAATFARALGWNGAELSTSYAACASGSQAIEAARARILAGLCEVALVVGADTTPKGFLAPTSGERWDDPDWLRFRLIGATNPTYFGMYARRRIELYGDSIEDFAMVKVKNSSHGSLNPNARYRRQVTFDDVMTSPVVADPLRLLDICATSDGGAALVISSMDFARKTEAKPVRIRAVAAASPTYPSTKIELPDIASDSGATVQPAENGFRASIINRVYQRAGVGSDDLDVAEVYDLSTAFELDWYEDLGLCGRGEARKLLSDGVTAIGGRVPVNPSGGLASFGEAVPAQAIAQVCEIVWQLRGQAGERQVEGAHIGITANEGLFGHASSVLLVR